MKTIFPLHTVKNYLNKFKKIKNIHISGIIPVANAFAINNSLSFLKKRVLVIVKSQGEAERLKKNLEELMNLNIETKEKFFFFPLMIPRLMMIFHLQKR
jgi:hypothetical protein